MKIKRLVQDESLTPSNDRPAIFVFFPIFNLDKFISSTLVLKQETVKIMTRGRFQKIQETVEIFEILCNLVRHTNKLVPCTGWCVRNSYHTVYNVNNTQTFVNKKHDKKIDI